MSVLKPEQLRSAESSEGLATARGLPPGAFPAVDPPTATAEHWSPKDRRQVVLSIIEYLKEHDED
jgi:hypothetical protein